MLFSIGPWLLSLLVFFPIMGVGIFGIDVDAGPLPAMGNLIVHLVYGAVLGTIFAVEESEWIPGTAGSNASSASAERDAVISILAGGVVGFVGGWLVAPTVDDLASDPVVALAGAFSGAAMGALIGSLITMQDDSTTVSPAAPVANPNSADLDAEHS